MQVGSGSVSFVTKMASAGAAVNAADAGTAGELAMLQSKLKAVMKQANDLAMDNSISDDLKRQMQQLLQNEIQMIQQRIAQLQSEGKRAAAPADDVKPKSDALKASSTTKQLYSTASAVRSGVDIFA